MLRCPDPSCSAAVGQNIVELLATDEDKEKYSRYLLRSYVEDNRKVHAACSTNYLRMYWFIFILVSFLYYTHAELPITELERVNQGINFASFGMYQLIFTSSSVKWHADHPILISIPIFDSTNMVLVRLGILCVSTPPS